LIYCKKKIIFFHLSYKIVVSRPDKLSGAEIASICQEAGMHAVRKNRYVILTKDLEKGYILMNIIIIIIIVLLSNGINYIYYIKNKY